MRVRFKGGVSKETVKRLKKKGFKVKTGEPTSEKVSSPNEERKRGREVPSEGDVRVISFDRVVLGSKWTSRLGWKQGDSLKIKHENDSLVLSGGGTPNEERVEK